MFCSLHEDVKLITQLSALSELRFVVTAL